MQCPNPTCGNRALLIEGERMVAITFEPDGRTVAMEEDDDWYIPDSGRAYCDRCHWDGFYRDCKEPGDANDAFDQDTPSR
jgi:hypothetical protein